MNFVLISPVGADVDWMPKTRPDQTTGTSVSTPTPWRDVHRLLRPHRAIRFTTDHDESTDSFFDSMKGEGFFFFLRTRTMCLVGESFLPAFFTAFLFTIFFSISAIDVHFLYCHLRNSAHYHNNDTVYAAAGCGR